MNRTQQTKAHHDWDGITQEYFALFPVSFLNVLMREGITVSGVAVLAEYLLGNNPWSLLRKIKLLYISFQRQSKMK